MAKKPARQRATPRPSVTPERFRRLYELVRLVGTGPRSRAALIGTLKIDLRGFYRDMGLLKSSGITVTLASGEYRLAGNLDEAAGMLPFPDPLLTLADARELAKGRGKAPVALAGRVRALTT